jgi:hypothetical protein
VDKSQSRLGLGRRNAEQIAAWKSRSDPGGGLSRDLQDRGPNLASVPALASTGAVKDGGCSAFPGFLFLGPARYPLGPGLGMDMPGAVARNPLPRLPCSIRPGNFSPLCTPWAPRFFRRRFRAASRAISIDEAPEGEEIFPCPAIRRRRPRRRALPLPHGGQLPPPGPFEPIHPRAGRHSDESTPIPAPAPGLGRPPFRRGARRLRRGLSEHFRQPPGGRWFFRGIPGSGFRSRPCPPGGRRRLLRRGRAFLCLCHDRPLDQPGLSKAFTFGGQVLRLLLQGWPYQPFSPPFSGRSNTPPTRSPSFRISCSGPWIPLPHELAAA